MCSINWTKSRGHILFHKILSKRSPWALKDEEPCLFYCKDTPNSLGGMRLFLLTRRKTSTPQRSRLTNNQLTLIEQSQQPGFKIEDATIMQMRLAIRQFVIFKDVANHWSPGQK